MTLDDYIHAEENRFYAWHATKNWDCPKSKVLALFAAYGLQVFEDEQERPYVLKADFRTAMFVFAPDQDKLKNVSRN